MVSNTRLSDIFNKAYLSRMILERATENNDDDAWTDYHNRLLHRWAISVSYLMDVSDPTWWTDDESKWLDESSRVLIDEYGAEEWLEEVVADLAEQAEEAEEQGDESDKWFW
jgi:hypothetical protein